MSTPETKWTPQPLYVIPLGEHGLLNIVVEGNKPVAFTGTNIRSREVNEANAARLTECWNVCFNLQNPAAEIAAMREALLRLCEAVDDFATSLVMDHHLLITSELAEAHQAARKVLSGGAQ